MYEIRSVNRAVVYTSPSRSLSATLPFHAKLAPLGGPSVFAGLSALEGQVFSRASPSRPSPFAMAAQLTHIGGLATQAVVNDAVLWGRQVRCADSNVGFFGHDELEILMGLPTESAKCVIEALKHNLTFVSTNFRDIEAELFRLVHCRWRLLLGAVLPTALPASMPADATREVAREAILHARNAYADAWARRRQAEEAAEALRSGVASGPRHTFWGANRQIPGARPKKSAR